MLLLGSECPRCSKKKLVLVGPINVTPLKIKLKKEKSCEHTHEQINMNHTMYPPQS